MNDSDSLPRVIDDDLAEALPAALERASLLEWRLEQVTLREKDLWLRLEEERAASAEAQERVAELSGRIEGVERALADARRANAALTARLAEAEGRATNTDYHPERDAAALGRALRRQTVRAEQQAAALDSARERLEVLEHAQVRFHARLTDWQRQAATDRPDLDLAEFISELRAEILRLGQTNAELRHQLEGGDQPSQVAVPLATEITTPRSKRSSYPPPAAGSAATAGPTSRLTTDDLWSADPVVRRRAATRLAHSSIPDDQRALWTALRLADDPDERVQLLTHLARHPATTRDANLEPYVDDAHPAVRAAAMDLTEAAEVLTRGADDDDPYVRRRALMRWLQVAPESATPALTRATHDPDPGVRRAACAGLAGRSTAACVQALLTAADDADANVRTAATRALPSPLRARLHHAFDSAQRRAILNAIRAERRAELRAQGVPRSVGSAESRSLGHAR